MDKKEEIMQAAFALFAEKGYSTSMSDIAKAVNIKVPSIYSHFQNKEEIFYLVVKHEMDVFADSFSDAIIAFEATECGEKLEELGTFLFRYYMDDNKIRFWKNIPMIYNRDLRIKCRELMKENDIRLTKFLVDIFSEGIKRKEIREYDIEGMIFLYLTMAQGVLDAVLINSDYCIDIRGYTQKAWTQFYDRIKNR